MPSVLSSHPQEGRVITKFTNCRLVLGDTIVENDLWVSAATGKILHSQASFYDEHAVPDQVIDLGGRIISPGLIECQLNGAFGFNFSAAPENMATYNKGLQELNQKLISTGVTSYVPTVTSQRPEVYQKVRSDARP
jgi:N-acetylglucosamine-6-phosphate deacetylase